MCTISIIMPLFNAEQYLQEALESILRQTYGDFELLCINDASNDKTMEILQRFQKLDKRIKIYSNECRSGAAVSRNRGLCEAKGKYVTFLDGDDIFEEEMLQIACQAMNEYHTDIVMYEYQHVTSECMHEKQSIPRDEHFIKQYCSTPFSIRSYSPFEFTLWSTSPCNKLYRSSFLAAHGLTFQSLPSSNDVYFVCMALLLAESVIMLKDRRVMVYARDHENPMRISFDRDPMCTYKAMYKVEETLINKGVFDYLYPYFYCRLFFEIRAALLKTKEETKAGAYYEFLSNEGINNLIALDGKYYQGLSCDIKNLLDCFKELPYSSKWYQEDNKFLFYLYKNKQKIITLLELCKEKKQKVTVWGAGVNGKAFLDFLIKNHLQISEIVDQNEQKQGESINGYIVKNPEGIWERAQVILVSSEPAYEAVAKKGKETHARVISLGQFVGKDKERVIVSLTSYPKRIGIVHQVIESLWRQTFAVDEIILYLSLEEFPNKEEDIPKKLRKMVGVNGFRIEWVPENLKSHKKYYYVLQDYSSNVVITVDDDMTYSETMVCDLIQSYRRFPFAVSARRARIVLKEEERLAPYRKWNGILDEYTLVERGDLCAIGVGGVLYPPMISNREWFDKKNMMGITEKQDDLWLKANEVLGDISIVYVIPSKEDSIISESMENAMAFQNLYSGVNDYCMQDLAIFMEKVNPDRYKKWFYGLLTQREYIAKKREFHYQKTEKLFEQAQNHPIYLYGAGIVASRILIFLSDLRLKDRIRAILVSDLEGNPLELDGMKIKTLDGLEDDEEFSVILGVSEKYQNEVEQKLQEYKYQKIDLDIQEISRYLIWLRSLGDK